MKILKFSIGSTVNAYATIEIPVPEGASKDQILAEVKQAVDSAIASSILPFNADWTSLVDLRIVTSGDPGVDELVEGASLEGNPPAICATECFYVHGSVVAQHPVFGLKLSKLDAESEAVYGGSYLIAAGVTWEVAQVLANSLGIIVKRADPPVASE